MLLIMIYSLDVKHTHGSFFLNYQLNWFSSSQRLAKVETDNYSTLPIDSVSV